MFFTACSTSVLSRSVPLSVCGTLEGVLLFADSPGQLFAGRHPKGRSAPKPFSHRPQKSDGFPLSMSCRACLQNAWTSCAPRISSTEIGGTSTGSVDITDTPPSSWSVSSSVHDAVSTAAMIESGTLASAVSPGTSRSGSTV